MVELFKKCNKKINLMKIVPRVVNTINKKIQKNTTLKLKNQQYAFIA